MKPKKTWKYQDLTCVAYDKSQARAQFKKILGVERLPVGAKVEQIGVEEFKST